MFDDAVKSIKAYLYDKTVSPLCGAFIISWLLVNHRFVMSIIFGETLEEKFLAMDNIIKTYDSWWIISGWFLYFIFIPLIFSLAYIFIYPYPAKHVYSFSKKRQMEINKLKNEIEQQRLLTVEESRELIMKHLELEDNYTSDLKRKDNEITLIKQELENIIIERDELKNKIESLSTQVELKSINGFVEDTPEEQVTNSNQEVQNEFPELTEKDIKEINNILLRIGDNRLTKQQIMSFSITSSIRLAYLLDILIDKRFIIKSDAGYHILTPAGRNYLIKNNLVE